MHRLPDLTNRFAASVDAQVFRRSVFPESLSSDPGEEFSPPAEEDQGT